MAEPNVGTYETADATRGHVRFRAVVFVLLLWCLFAIALLLLRWEAARWGWVMADWQWQEWGNALGWHVGGLVILLATMLGTRKARPIAPILGRLLLTLMPIVLLLSLDRIVGIAYRPIQESVGMLIPHESRLWTHRPNWVEIRDSTEYRINSAGLRGPEIPCGKPVGERRILFLGDSIAFCAGLARDDCFVWQTEAVLNSHDPGAVMRAVNCSGWGYSPWQQYDLLVNDCMAFDPDIIVHAFCLNDIGQKFNLAKYGGATNDLAPPEPAALEWSGVFRMARAVTFQLFGPTREELIAREKAFDPDRAIDDPASDDMKRAWKVTLGNLDKIVSWARSQGVPITIVVFPVGRQIQPGLAGDDAPQRTLADYCESRGVPYLNLLRSFQSVCEAKGICGDQLIPDGLHPSLVANRIATKALVEHLSALGWVGTTHDVGED